MVLPCRPFPPTPRAIISISAGCCTRPPERSSTSSSITSAFGTCALRWPTAIAQGASSSPATRRTATPYGGYGINSGLEDAVNLSWKLAAHLQGWGGAGLLDSYDAERRPVFASTARDFIEKSIFDDRDFLRRHQSPTVDRADFEAAWRERQSGARAEVNAFEPNCEGSPIVLRTAGCREQRDRFPSPCGTRRPPPHAAASVVGQERLRRARERLYAA